MTTNELRNQSVSSRIHLNESEFELPKSIPWQKDEDVEVR